MNPVAIREDYTVQRHNKYMPSIQEMKDLAEICKTLSQAPFYQKLGASGVLAIWLTARELNVPPMLSLNGGLHNIEGKVSMSAQLMNMMIINAGHKIDVLRLDDEGCRIRFTRVYKNGSEKSDEYEFVKKDAERAKYFGEPGPNGSMLSKPKANWVLYPRDMYFARALSGGAKKYLPDVMMNVYVFGEIEDTKLEQVIETNNYVSNIDTIGQPPAFNECEKISESALIQFKNKFGIGSESEHERYLSAISDKSKKTLNELIICAAMNEDGFVVAFDKWKSAIQKKKEESIVSEDINTTKEDILI